VLKAHTATVKVLEVMPLINFSNNYILALLFRLTLLLVITAKIK
jgi:hypothetical protein